MNKTKLNSRYMAGCGLLSALAFVLQFIEVGLPVMPSFIKFDFSDLPALIGAYTYGPTAGVIIELVKNLLHCLVTQSAAIGELANFILGAVFTGLAGAIYRRRKTRRTAALGGLTGAFAMGLISFPANLFIVYPFYYNFMPEGTVLSLYQVILPGVSSIQECLLVFNLPFTIVKGLLCLGVCMLIYKKISPILKGVAR